VSEEEGATKRAKRKIWILLHFQFLLLGLSETKKIVNHLVISILLFFFLNIFINKKLHILYSFSAKF
jgi:hypothetical protein